MNQKILRYGLIAGVVLVWGMIIQQVFSAMGDDNRNMASPVADTMGLPGMPVDTFSLLLNYSDPFLVADTADEPEVVADTPKIIPDVPMIAPEPAPDISFIKYMGMIANNENKSRAAIINFKGRDMMVREEQDVEDVTIKKIKGGELSFVFRNKTYRLPKTNQ